MLLHHAIFFDFDGVLAESIDIKERAFRDLYAEFGPEVEAAALAHHKANEGISRLHKIRHCHKALLGIELDDQGVAALGRRYSDRVEDAVIACDWVAGARAFLEAHHGKLPMFVVSGTPDDELKRVVGGRGMTHFFTSVHGSPPRKPPIVSGLLDAHGLSASSSVFVGDAMTDYDAARATGVDFIGRVAPGRESPFPAGTRTLSDLTTLEI